MHCYLSLIPECILKLNSLSKQIVVLHWLWEKWFKDKCFAHSLKLFQHLVLFYLCVYSSLISCILTRHNISLVFHDSKHKCLIKINCLFFFRLSKLVISWKGFLHIFINWYGQKKFIVLKQLFFKNCFLFKNTYFCAVHFFNPLFANISIIHWKYATIKVKEVHGG